MNDNKIIGGLVRNRFVSKLLFILTLPVLVISFQNFYYPEEVGASFKRDLLGRTLSFPTDFSKTIYLDCADGSDDNTGESATLALKTLSEVNTEIKDNNVTRVLIKRGSICRDTLELKNAKRDSITVDTYHDNATASSPIPVIVGSEDISTKPWRAYAGYVANNLPFFSVTTTEAMVYQLYVNGIRKPVSSNVDTCKPATFDPMLTGIRQELGSSYYNQLELAAGDPLFYHAHTPGSIVLVRDGAWRWKNYLISSLNASQRRVSFLLGTNEILDSPTSNKNGYRILNSRSGMDCAGEWFFNTQYKVLTYFNDLEQGLFAPTRKIEISVRAYGVDANFSPSMRKNVYIRNLRIRHAGDSSLLIKYAKNVLIENVYSDDSNGHGILLYGAQNLSIFNSSFKSSAFMGIVATNVTGRLHVEKNMVEDSGRLDSITDLVNEHMAGMFLSSFGSLIVRNNYISGSGYSGMQLAPKLQTLTVIDNNTVSASCRYANDCAGIYVNGYDYVGYLGTDNIINGARGIGELDKQMSIDKCNAPIAEAKTMFIRKNRVYNSLGYTKGVSALGHHGYLAGGIYLDWGTGNADISNNFISNVRHMRGAIHIHGGMNVSVDSNRVDQSLSGFPAMSIAQLWNREGAAIATCRNVVRQNSFISSGNQHYLIQMRINNYEGGSTNYQTLAQFMQNDLLYQTQYPVRQYAFDENIQDTEGTAVPLVQE